MLFVILAFELLFVIRAFASLLPAADRALPGLTNLASADAAITLATCVGLSDTLGALKRHPSYWMGCVVLNIEATTQPVSLL